MKYSTVVHNGKNYIVNFGLAAIQEFCDLTDTKLSEFSLGIDEDNVDLNKIVTLVYVGLKHGARRSMNAFNYELIDIYDLIEDEGFELVNLIAEKVNESTLIQAEPGSKKKTKKK